MLMRDGGGGGSTPQVTSSVTVDPGEIREFAKFLHEMETELNELRTLAETGKQVPANAFGVYHSSESAAKKHTATLDAEIANLKTLVTRLGEVANGATEVSKIYNDLADLNEASGTAISAHLVATTPNK